MFRRIKTLKDAYITNRIIKGTRQTKANTGQAGTLDLFKIYGNTFSGSVALNELSRLLIKFDLTDLQSLVSSGLVDITNSSFKCKIKLFDVASASPTPINFTVVAHPLSKSWDEGIGRDVTSFASQDTVNWITSSYTDGVITPWVSDGAGTSGSIGQTVDILSAYSASQTFVAGTEDLEIDITTAISATLAGVISDHGFRLAFTDTEENDDKTRFVKRFASRHANEAGYRPRLLVHYNDSVINNQNNFTIDQSGSLFLYNNGSNGFVNLVSGSSLTSIAGANCLKLRLETEVSGGWYSLTFTGSQHQIGTNYIEGVYVTSFAIPTSDTVVRNKMLQSGSVNWKQIWGSLDGTVGYLTSSFTLQRSAASNTNTTAKKYYINAMNTQAEYDSDYVARIRLFVFDPTNVVVGRQPVESTCVTLNNAHYQVRDSITNKLIIAPDFTYNATRLSSDSSSLYFDLDMASLETGRTYSVDVIVKEGVTTVTYPNVSPVFKVSEIE